MVGARLPASSAKHLGSFFNRIFYVVLNYLKLKFGGDASNIAIFRILYVSAGMRRSELLGPIDQHFNELIIDHFLNIAPLNRSTRLTTGSESAPHDAIHCPFYIDILKNDGRIFSA